MLVKRSVVVVVAVVVGSSGCNDVKDHLADGNIDKACRRADKHPDEEADFQAWLKEHATVTATVVPHKEVGALVGGPVRGYGDDLAVFRLSAAVPGGKAQFVDAPVRGGNGPLDLVQRLPPLRRMSRAPSLPALNPTELMPLRRQRSYNYGGGGGLVGGIFDAMFAVGEAVGGVVGTAVGLAIAVPVAAIGGAISIVGDIFNGIFGGHASSAPPAIDLVPIETFDPPVIPSIDGLLSDRHGEAQQRVDGFFATWKGLVDVERARRLALLDSDPFKKLNSCVNESRCDVVGSAPADNVNLRLRFDVEDERPCGRELVLPLSPPAINDDDKAAPEKTAVEVALDDAAAAVDLVDNLDDAPPHRAPSYALEHPSTTTRKLRPPAVAVTVDDVVCRVKPRSRGDLVVRFTSGFDHLHTRTVALGKTSDASFFVPGAHLKRGERVRLGVVDRNGDSKGGAVVVFDGALPLLFSNAAFTASCGEATDVDEKKLAALLQKSDAAVAAALTAADAQDKDGLAARPKMRRTRDAAEAAILALAGELGPRAEPVLQRVASLAVLDLPPPPPPPPLPPPSGP